VNMSSRDYTNSSHSAPTRTHAMVLATRTLALVVMGDVLITVATQAATGAGCAC